MARGLTISAEGRFELDGRPYRIPDRFTRRQAYSYRRLLEPIPDIPGGTTLSRSQRARQREFFLRRAAACVVPGLGMKALQAAGDGPVRAIHRWISDNRPGLAGAPQGDERTS